LRNEKQQIEKICTFSFDSDCREAKLSLVVGVTGKREEMAHLTDEQSNELMSDTESLIIRSLRLANETFEDRGDDYTQAVYDNVREKAESKAELNLALELLEERECWSMADC
jgi:hypothetical protein